MGTTKTLATRFTLRKPQTLVKAKPGARLEVQFRYHDGKKHLPIVELKAFQHQNTSRNDAMIVY